MAANQAMVQPSRRKSNIASGRACWHTKGMAGLTNNQITGLALAVVVGGMAIASVYDSNQPAAVSAAVPAFGPEPPALIESAALAAAFDDNEIAASAKYAGALRIRGTIAEITTTFGGAPLLLLDGGVNIALQPSELASAADLHKGEAIEVMCGKVRAALGSVNGLDCAILPAAWTSPDASATP